MNILGTASLPGLLASSLDSVASRNLEDATKARRAFEVTQRDAEKTTPANSAGLSANGAQTANTLFAAQNFAQEFKDFMDKSPDQMMREAILKELGYSEEDLANMDPKELAKVEDKIREMMEIKIEQAMREKGIEVEIGGAPAAGVTIL